MCLIFTYVDRNCKTNSICVIMYYVLFCRIANICRIMYITQFDTKLYLSNYGYIIYNKYYVTLFILLNNYYVKLCRASADGQSYKGI